MVTENPPWHKGGASTGHSFRGRLTARAHRIRSWLCVGLDPDVARLPSGAARSTAGVLDFCTAILEATGEAAAAFKINFAFFEALGPDGWRALDTLRRHVPADVPVIADAKRGDIGNTSRAYARAIFDVMEFDAVTVNPYLGWDSLLPFVERSARGVFVLCKTSNPGSADLQDLDVDGEPLYLRVAREAVALRAAADIGLVVGATQPDAMRAVRAVAPTALFLVPGIGTQGGTIDEAMRNGADASGDGVLIAMSRDILYASSGSDFAEVAAIQAREYAAETWREA